MGAPTSSSPPADSRLPTPDDLVLFAGHPEKERWAASLEALARDADARLPGDGDVEAAE
jgi:hypothetical protein